MATPVDGPSNGMSQAISVASQSGAPTVAPWARRHVDGASDRAVVQRRMGSARDQDKDVFHAPPLAAGRWICKQSARHGPAARHRHHRPDRQRQVGGSTCARAEAAGHGDQCRRHADLRRLPDPDRPAHGRGTAGVPHRLYGVLPLSETLSAARWRTLAAAEIERCLAEGRTPILCGGSGLYLRTLMQGIAAIPEFAGRRARPGQRRMAGDGRRGLPRPARRAGSGDRGAAEARRSPAPCPRLGSLSGDRPAAQRLAARRWRGGALALRHGAAGARARAGCATASRAASMAC